MPDQENDLRCILLIRQGDSGALAELYDRYSSVLYSLILRAVRTGAEADAALQEAWLQVWNQALAYDPRNGSVAAWIIAIARARAIAHHRFVSDRNPVAGPAESAPERRAVSPAHQELHQRVVKALEKMEPESRQTLEIAYFEGLSWQEISKKTGSPLESIRVWTRQALHRLGELLSKEEWQ